MQNLINIFIILSNLGSMILTIVILYMLYKLFFKREDYLVHGKTLKLTKREYSVLLEFVDICKNSEN